MKTWWIILIKPIILPLKFWKPRGKFLLKKEVLLVFTFVPKSWTADLSPQQILAKVDANHQYQTSTPNPIWRLLSVIGRWPRPSIAGRKAESRRPLPNSWIKGINLGLKDDLFSPSAEREVNLSVGGSDFSYRDMLENLHLLDLYNVSKICTNQIHFLRTRTFFGNMVSDHLS